MRTTGDAPVTVRHLTEPKDVRTEMAADIMSGLTSTPKAIPSKYFYDARGSQLFEAITRLPEYYLTGAEREILEVHADDIMALARPHELVELGSGSSDKTRLLIDAMRRTGAGTRYVPVDISEDALLSAAKDLCVDYTWLEIEGLVGDFHSDLPAVPRRGRRLAMFLGSTIGNLQARERRAFLGQVRQILQPGDHFLLGVDLVKDVDTMVAAYNDSTGVTAEFTKNILHVVNRELGADFPVEVFEHVPRWNPTLAGMEAWLRASRAVTVRVVALNMEIEIDSGEMIHTEVSCKFTQQSVVEMLAGTGMVARGWFTDPAGRFALVLARRE